MSVAGGAGVTDLAVTLDEIAIPEAYHSTAQATLVITVGLAWRVGGGYNDGCIRPGVIGQGIGFPGTNLRFVVEETWEPHSAFCAKAIAIDRYSPQTDSIQNPSFDNPHYGTNYPSDVWGATSPVIMAIPRTAPGDPNATDDPARVEFNEGEPIDPDGEWTLRNFLPGKRLTNLPADINCFTEQRMDVYFTAFYLDPMPSVFSARPEA